MKYQESHLAVIRGHVVITHICICNCFVDLLDYLVLHDRLFLFESLHRFAVVAVVVKSDYAWNLRLFEIRFVVNSCVIVVVDLIKHTEIPRILYIVAVAVCARKEREEIGFVFKHIAFQM